MTQEEAREKREAAKKKQLDNLTTSGKLTQHAVASEVQANKALETIRKKTVKNLYQGGNDEKKGKADKNEGAVAKSQLPKKKKAEPVLPMIQKKRRKESEKNPQGERKVPKAADKHGCRHYGLLELIPMDRKYLQAFVKVGGWLYETPCADCAKKEEGDNERVMEVASLLELKGRGGLGYYCNCGPNGHKMSEADEPGRKQEWSCNLILCSSCFNKRREEMGETTTRRSRRQNQPVGS